MAATATRLSIEDYLELEEPPGERYELSEGELIVSPSSTAKHNEIRDGLAAGIRTFLKLHPLGFVTSETDVRLGEQTVRRPDVAFFRLGRLQGVDLDRSPLPLAPDLVIEAVSRHDRGEDLMLKTEQYLRAGTRAVWLLYPKTQAAQRYAGVHQAPVVRSAELDESLEEPELLPQLSLKLKELFALSQNI